ncbi:hypothetical protein [Nitrososphaera sp.]|uniref:hypothetical protein n=1 Tax=Nitrososphaera sp. TaxID=1971748 RepID=UPI00307E23CD
MQGDANREGAGAAGEEELQGRALQVYLYLQRRGAGMPSGIRQIQRDLGLSSPSVAEYQVDKLAAMGLVTRDRYGRVSLARKAKKARALEAYVSVGRFSVPRLAFYAAAFSAVAVLYVVFNAGSSGITAYGVAVPAAAAAVLWLEARRMWKAGGGGALAGHAKDRKRMPEQGQEEEGLWRRQQPLWIMLLPGIAGLGVFAAGAVFLSQYAASEHAFMPLSPSSSPLQADYYNNVPQESGSSSSSQITLEESLAMSRQKVADGGMGWAPHASADLAAAMTLVGSLAVGFIAYIVARYRCERGSVLDQGQAALELSGTQGYSGRLR